ncbi:MAG TPA: o-succinylbenzoate synthase [bacterium]|nr:o-succinylbenzoate synthase [bacterium]HPR86738.1 o-succinylbenzoate synthase [bacterium]
MKFLQTPIGPIDRIDLLTVRLPFLHPFAISSYAWSCKEALLLKVEAGGVTGWGECVADPDPFYAPETTASCRYIIQTFLLPLLEPGMTLADLSGQMHKVRGNEMAKATLENAVIDLLAKQQGKKLHEFLGLPARKIMSGISLGLQETPDKLLEAVTEAVAKKYHRVKMKIKKGQDIEWVAAVRKRFPEIQLMADANGDYTLADAARLRELDAFNLMMIEQPLSYSDIYQHALLQQQLATPLCLDESIHSLDDARTALELGACRIINIKQGRVGGLIEALAMAELAARRSIPVWSGGMDETGIGRAVNIHLQTAPGFILPGDTSETSRYFHEDIADPPVVLDAQGGIDIPPGAGIGVEIPAGRLARYTIAQERLYEHKG